MTPYLPPLLSDGPKNSQCSLLPWPTRPLARVEPSS